MGPSPEREDQKDNSEQQPHIPHVSVCPAQPHIPEVSVSPAQSDHTGLNPEPTKQKKASLRRLQRYLQTVISPLLTVALVFIAYGQLAAMDGQLRVMQEQTNSAVEGDKRTERMVRAIEAMKESMVLAVKQANHALNASIEASRADRRAWLTVTSIRSAVPLKVGAKPPAILTVKNTGKSPANEIGPGDQMLALIDASESFTTSTQIEAIASGSHHLFAKGFIEYRDVFSVQRRTTFCYSTKSVSGGEWAACVEGNRAE